MIKRKGLAQIPLMIGLLIMAVAVPVATKLVQESQDTRNQAASCGTSGTISQCGSKGGCATGYRCLPNGCSYDPACGGFVPTNTPRPTATPTKRPTATPTKRPPTPTPNPCSVSTERPNNCTCTYSNQCESGYCAGGTVCLPKPTATPNPNACNQVYENTKCVNSAEYTCTNNVWVKTKTCTGPCVNNACPKAPTNTPKPPTNTPVPRCTDGSRRCNGKNIERCQSGIWYTAETCSFMCNNALCVKPTNTPTPTSSSSCSASNLYQCGSLGGCPTGYRCMLSGSYYCKYDSSCSGGPTNTPKPTNTPTKAPCKTAGQLCNTTTQLCCLNQGLKCEAAICCVINGNTPPNGDKNYCCSRYVSGGKCAVKPTNTPTPTGPLKCYCMDNCGSYDCNWQSAAGGGYNRYCTADYCSYVPTPRQPTATPTKACSKTGGTCNSQGDCCPGNVCWNGHCYLSSGPTQVPTTNPTGTYPTSGPIPTTKPPVGDKCPGAEACPNPSNKNLLQNCTPPDSDGTPNDTLCTKAGMIEPCGGKSYCCPSAGGAWTSDMTKCIGTVTLIPTKIPTAIPTNPPDFLCTQCPGKPQAKLKGDADCDGEITINDYQIWIDEFRQGNYGGFNKNTWRSDFDCDGLVSLNDYQIWIDNFKIIQ